MPSPRLAALVVVSSLALATSAALWGSGTPFFGDADYRLRQIKDLQSASYGDVSCVYPARPLDPDLRLLSASNPVVVRDGRCFYLYPFALAYVFGPVVGLIGKTGIFVMQQVFSAAILLAMIAFGRALGMSELRILLAVLLFRFGTGNLLSGFDLEDHTIAAAMAIGGSAWAFFRKTPPARFAAGVVAGLSFAFRPELGLVLVALPAALYSVDRKLAERSGPGLILLGTGLVLAIGSVAFLNSWLVGHWLGIKALDPLHAADLATRAAGIARNLLFHPQFPTNGLLAHMPLLLILSTYVAKSERARERTPEELRALRFALVFVGICLPVLLIVAPPLPTAAAGLRFASFLYPLMVLLCVKQIPPFRIRPKLALLWTAAAALSCLLTVGLMVLGLFIDKEFQKLHAQVRSIRAPVIVTKDRLAQQVAGPLFHERKVVFAASDADLLGVLGRARTVDPGPILVVRHKMAPGPALLPADVAGSWAVERADAGHVEMAVLRSKR